MGEAWVKTIYKPVYYDPERKGFFYQLTADAPEQGPFTTRSSAIADACWQLHD